MSWNAPFAAALFAGTLAFGSAVALSAQDEQEPLKHYVFTSADGDSVVGGGSDEGYADFSAEIDPSTGEICYTLSTDLQMTVAHIHKGKPGENGAPVMTLQQTPEEDSVCETIDTKLAKDIGGKPGNYYVNVHTAEFPGGAIRGQLEE
ncbi:CHRD domain-containing protein [Parerythrobacter aestuarii]|uniref:CHRD domain-containing protein n=1 Tax=Parerythrobacter aestuarii TaxID=3020909 RepID=UPI0024DE27BF|nr:CHRD domain-containing protein [Parerythrobacter aestuarii]